MYTFSSRRPTEWNGNGRTGTPNNARKQTNASESDEPLTGAAPCLRISNEGKLEKKNGTTTLDISSSADRPPRPRRWSAARIGCRILRP